LFIFYFTREQISSKTSSIPPDSAGLFESGPFFVHFLIDLKKNKQKRQLKKGQVRSARFPRTSHPAASDAVHLPGSRLDCFSAGVEHDLTCPSVKEIAW